MATSTDSPVDDDGEEDGIDDDIEILQLRTTKPTAKGRQLYLSSKIHLVEKAEINNVLYLRANVEASMSRTKHRYVCLAILNCGKIDYGSCTCYQGNQGRCSHVSAVLHLAEEMSLGASPRLHVSCTSVTQVWGKGQIRENDPTPVHMQKYHKKRQPDKYFDTDPRPLHLQKTTVEEKDNFLKNIQSLHRESMWGKLLRFYYEDYELSPERAVILRELVARLEMKFAEDTLFYHGDPLSNSYAVHVTGSEEQADSHVWENMREMRITASVMKPYSSSKCSFAQSQWEQKPDLSNNKAVAWGKENEQNARETYEKMTGKKVTRCGLFISKQYPMLASSPDGLIEDNDGTGVLEIKCPFLLKNLKPLEVCKLTRNQQRSFSCVLSDDKLVLKKSHAYYLQIQCQLFVTKRKYCDFVI